MRRSAKSTTAPCESRWGGPLCAPKLKLGVVGVSNPSISNCYNSQNREINTGKGAKKNKKPSSVGVCTPTGDSVENRCCLLGFGTRKNEAKTDTSHVATRLIWPKQNVSCLSVWVRHGPAHVIVFKTQGGDNSWAPTELQFFKQEGPGTPSAPPPAGRQRGGRCGTGWPPADMPGAPAPR